MNFQDVFYSFNLTQNHIISNIILLCYKRFQGILVKSRFKINSVRYLLILDNYIDTLVSVLLIRCEISESRFLSPCVVSSVVNTEKSQRGWQPLVTQSSYITSCEAGLFHWRDHFLGEQLTWRAASPGRRWSDWTLGLGEATHLFIV